MSELQARQAAIVSELSGIGDWKDRYRKIIEVGRALPAFPEAHRTDENIVKGCQNRVWLHATLEDGRVRFVADSEAQIVRGLVALLVRAYDDATPDEILATPPEFIQALDLGEHLTMNRANGLAAMVKQMKFYAMAFKAILARQTT